MKSRHSEQKSNNPNRVEFASKALRKVPKLSLALASMIPMSLIGCSNDTDAVKQPPQANVQRLIAAEAIKPLSEDSNLGTWLDYKDIPTVYTVYRVSKDAQWEQIYQTDGLGLLVPIQTDGSSTTYTYDSQIINGEQSTRFFIVSSDHTGYNQDQAVVVLSTADNSYSATFFSDNSNDSNGNEALAKQLVEAGVVELGN